MTTMRLVRIVMRLRTRISQLLQRPTSVVLNLWSPDTPGEAVNIPAQLFD